MAIEYETHPAIIILNCFGNFDFHVRGAGTGPHGDDGHYRWFHVRVHVNGTLGYGEHLCKIGSQALI